MVEVEKLQCHTQSAAIPQNFVQGHVPGCLLLAPKDRGSSEKSTHYFGKEHPYRSK